MVNVELFPLLLESAIKSTIILGLAAVAAFWLRRGSAAARHMAWQLGLVAAVALPLVSALVPKLEVLPSPARREAREVGPVEETAASLNGPIAKAEPRDAAGARAGATEPATDASPPAASPKLTLNSVLQAAVRYAAIIWLLGAVLVLARFALGLAIVRWYMRKSRPLDAVEWASLNETMSFAVGLGQPVKLLKSERAATPMTFGVINPVVLLPADADSWPEERRRIVLLHELAHVQRLDSLTHIFANVACALYWFNPFVWITAARLRAEAERACDDWVLRAGMRASTYADHLLDMVRTIGRLHTPVVALPMAQRSTFEGRLLAILEPGLNRNGLTRGQALLLTTVVALVVLPLAAMAPATAAPGGAGLPLSSALTQDTAKKSGDQERPERPRGLARRINSAIDGVFRGTAYRASSEIDLEAVVDEAVEDVNVSRIANDAMNAVMAGGSQQRQLGERALNALVGALADADVEVRRSAVHSLGNAEDPRAVAALSKALREDKDAEVRRTAAWALGQIEDARAIPALADALRKDDDVEVRRQAAWALGHIEDAAAIDALADALKDADKGVRAQAVWAMGQIEDRRAVPALQAAVRDGDVEIRRQAVWALGQIEDPSAVPVLAGALRDADSSVRRQVAWALGQIEDASAIPVLAAALKDADAAVRNQAAWALGQIEQRPAPAQLLEALKDADPGVKRTAVWALGQIEDPQSAAALREAMKDADRAVKLGALRALTRLGDDAAYDALAEMLKDPDPAVRRMAAQALGRGGLHWPEPRPQPQPQPRPQPRGW